MSFTAIQLGYPHKARVQAMAAGVAALGGKVIVVAEEIAADDLLAQIRAHAPRFAFTCGLHRATARSRGILAGLGLPLLVLDCGWFHRAEGGADVTGYNQLGLDRLNWVPPSSHRSPKRWAAHGLAIAPRRPVGADPQVLLVLGQVPNDSQHQLGEYQLAAWLTEHAAAFYACGWKIFYRAHPRHVFTKLNVPHTRLESAVPLASQLPSASAVLTYNSTAGLEALLAGVPVHCHESAHYSAVSQLTDPAALLDHCERLAAAQWTCDELRAGEPVRFMDQFAALLP